jgi:hypothetical protein
VEISETRGAAAAEEEELAFENMAPSFFLSLSLYLSIYLKRFIHSPVFIAACVKVFCLFQNCIDCDSVLSEARVV